MGNRLGVSKSKHGRSSLMQKFDSHDADTASGYAENSSLVRMVSTMHDTNLETFMLVWLDPRIDTDRGYIEMQKRLKDAFTCCIVFDDNNKCEQWLKRSTDDDRLVLVVSGAFGQMIVPKVHDMKQIVDIYVYCRNKSRHQRWTKNFSKVRKVIIDTDKLIKRILKDQKNRENIEDSRALSIIDQNKLASNTTSIEDAFIWYELLLDVLFNHIPSTSTFDDLIKILLEYSSDNEEGLLQIDEFKKSYESRKALLYIINDTPLARFVNKALRNQDIYMIFALRFLLTDIRQQLINHRQQSVHVFKWHIMSKMQLDSVSSKPGQILMINGFLFTTKRLNNELCPEKPSQDSEIVLFDIDAIYQNETSTPFADIGDIDQCQHRNDEIIFMCGSISEHKTLETIEDMLFQLADEIARLYRQEANQHVKKGEFILAKCKDTLVSRMFHELMEIQEEETVASLVISSDVTVVCLTRTSNPAIKEKLDAIVPSLLLFDNETLCL
ncbi:unnamed protein product, partial [Rotaria sp. Silwood1]